LIQQFADSGHPARADQIESLSAEFVLLIISSY
jgi:hypothetical protein